MIKVRGKHLHQKSFLCVFKGISPQRFSWNFSNIYSAEYLRVSCLFNKGHYAWKLSVFEVFVVRIFHHSDCIRRDMEYPYSVRMRKNTNQKNSKDGHRLRIAHFKTSDRSLTHFRPILLLVSVFSITFSPVGLIRKRLCHRCFQVNFIKFLRTNFL